MSLTPRERAVLRELARRGLGAKDENRKRYEKYREDPIGYNRDVLGGTWWAKQEEIARAVVKHRRVFVQASHSIGKSHLEGGLVNWFYDTRDPGLTLTTAPTQAQVVDVLWKEVRRQRQGRPGLSPAAPRLQSAPDHYAAGYTARDSDAFQGRHEESVFIEFDEAVGVAPQYWDAAEGMMTGEDCHFLACMNPTSTSSRAYQESVSGRWHVIVVSALEHPNIAAELAGLPAPYPAAIRLTWLLEKIESWCQPIPPELRTATDFEFPPGSGAWHRPGALFESRVLGRFPSRATDAVWSQAAFEAALLWSPIPDVGLELGCDVARHGDDFTTIITRRGRCALTHLTYNGNGGAYTAGAIKRAVQENVRPGEDPKKVPLKIDDNGIGGILVDFLIEDGWNAIPVNASTSPVKPEGYPNRRSELWFDVSERAEAMQLDLSRLPSDAIDLLRSQLLAPRWTLDALGRRVVEPKDVLKDPKRLGRSPDDADALNLAFAPIVPQILEASAFGSFSSASSTPVYTPR